MKKFLALVLSALMLLSLVACGQPADTTDPTVTDAPETDAPETDAPETDAPETDAPETDAPETGAPIMMAIPTANEDNLIFDLTFDNVDAIFSELPSGFTLKSGAESWDLFSGDDGYIQLKTGLEVGAQRLTITDDSMALLQDSFVIEFEAEYSQFPSQESGDVSVMTWCPKVNGDTKYEYFKLGADNVMYSNKIIGEVLTKKLELNKRYTFTCVYDIVNGEKMLFIDGEFMFASALLDASLATSGTIRLQADNAAMKLYGLKAFYLAAE